MIKPRLKKIAGVWACRLTENISFGLTPIEAYRRLQATIGRKKLAGEIVKINVENEKINEFERAYRQAERMYEKLRKPML